jgi:Holliday junction resolvase
VRKKEGRLKDKIREYVETVPNVYYHPVVTRGVGKKGAPDIFLCHKGRFIAIETKATEKDEPTPLQKRRLREIAAAGGVALVVDESNWEVVKLHVN